MGEIADYYIQQELDDDVFGHPNSYKQMELDMLSVILRVGDPNSKLNKKLDKVDKDKYNKVRDILRWKTKTGNVLFVKDMDDNHLANSHRKLIRDKSEEKWIWALTQELKHRELPT